MSRPRHAPFPATERERIGTKVRQLRLDRGWTQVDLARRLGLSQARLSEIERGGGSFTAEQLLLILRLFNVDVSEFDQGSDDEERQLQNALIRHGAAHLREDPEATRTDRFHRPIDAIRAVLVRPSAARLVTALAPALVWSMDDVPLAALQNELAAAGVPNRLGWLVENTLVALRVAPEGPTHGSPWRLRRRRAETVLDSFLRHVTPTRPQTMPDPLDPSIRSVRTQQSVWERASPISRRWGIASGLDVSDFELALRKAHESDR